MGPSLPQKVMKGLMVLAKCGDLKQLSLMCIAIRVLSTLLTEAQAVPVDDFPRNNQCLI